MAASAPPRLNAEGCRAGDPANHILPWSTSERLAVLPVRNMSIRVPACDSCRVRNRPLRRCAMLVDRHVHKNGGSTIRDLFLEHERQGLALYHGYQHNSWSDDYRALRFAAEEAVAEEAVRRGSTADAPRVLLVESHFGRIELEDVLPTLSALSQLYAAQGIECPLVTMTRIRPPLDFYLSFYRWSVGFRQRDNPEAYGRTFAEWVERVPNLQSTMMIRSMASYAAECALVWHGVSRGVWLGVLHGLWRGASCGLWHGVSRGL